MRQKHTKKIWRCLLVSMLSLSVFGCGDGGSSNGGGDNAGAPVVITVTDYSGIRVPDATVVMGDSSGAMRSYGVTDANGQITFETAPANATITAAKTCLRSGSTTITYSLEVQYDVNGSAVLLLDNCAEVPSILPPVNDAPLGTMTVNVTNIPSDVVRNQVTVGGQVFLGYGNLITKQTVTITENDLDSNGTFSITVIGLDAYYNRLAYGFLRNQDFTDGMTVDIPMEPLSSVQYQIINIPSTAVSLDASMYISGGGIAHGDWSSYPLLSAPSSTTINVSYLPVVGDQIGYQIGVDIDRNHDSGADAYQSLSLRSSAGTPSNQIFDLSKALPAPTVTVTGADTATPTFSWSGVDPASASFFVSANLRSPAINLYLSPGNLMRSRTSIRYPELPDSLATFRPNKVDYFYVYTSAYEGDVSKMSSGSYQAPNP